MRQIVYFGVFILKKLQVVTLHCIQDLVIYSDYETFKKRCCCLTL